MNGINVMYANKWLSDLEIKNIKEIENKIIKENLNYEKCVDMYNTNLSFWENEDYFIDFINRNELLYQEEENFNKVFKGTDYQKIYEDDNAYITGRCKLYINVFDEEFYTGYAEDFFIEKNGEFYIFNEDKSELELSKKPKSLEKYKKIQNCEIIKRGSDFKIRNKKRNLLAWTWNGYVGCDFRMNRE